MRTNISAIDVDLQSVPHGRKRVRAVNLRHEEVTVKAAAAGATNK